MIALLPLKEHSERVPGKNWRDFCGRPLYEWILDTLLRVPDIQGVVINTDCERMFDRPPDSRILLRERKPELCGDHVSMNEIIADDILAVPGRDYLQTHATNPLISADTIARAIDCYRRRSQAFDSMFSVNRIQNRLYWDGSAPINHDPDELLRTQDLRPVWEENSCLYLFPNHAFLCNRTRIGRHPAIFETPRLESIDIDTEADWKLAEAIAANR